MQIIKKIIVWTLTLESRLILAKYKPFIVAVTGSVGKTATKDAIYSVLKGFAPAGEAGAGEIRRSEKSFNSEFGLPLTIIGVPTAWRSIAGWMRNIGSGLRVILDHGSYPKCLILEIGADHPGDIKKAVKWLHPDIAVINRVSDLPVHVEFFKSPEQVFEEKAALAGGIKKGGTLVLYADDAKVIALAGKAAERGASAITFGTDETASVRGSDCEISYENGAPIGFSFKLQMDGNSVPITVRHVIGKTFMYPLLAASAVAKARGMSVNAIVNGLNAYEAPKGRMNIISGLNGSTIIDDTYNSSPDAASAALKTLNETHVSGKKIAILGDMMELGKYSADEHRKIGREAAAILGASGVLVTIGLRSKATAEEAVKDGMPVTSVHQFGSSDEAAAFVPGIVQSGDLILVKGSQSPRVERVTRALMREPARAAELLVRQEKEWLEKK